MGLRRPGPGLVGMAARTAVVAGTATAVSGRVARRQQNKYEQQAYEQQAQYAPQPQYAEPAPAPPPAAAPADDDLPGKLQQLANLHSSGVLSDAEFDAAKQKLISG